MNQQTSPTSEGATGTPEPGKPTSPDTGATAPAEDGATEPQRTIEELRDLEASTSVPEAGSRDEAKAKTPEGEKAKPKSLTQERINSAVRAQREAERQAGAERQRADRAEARLAKAQGVRPDPGDEKYRGDNGADAYQADLTAFEVRQQSREDRQADVDDAREAAKHSDQTAADQRTVAYSARAEEFAGSVPDFDDKVGKLRVSDEMADQIQDSETGPQIAYFLATNPAEMSRLAGKTSPTDVAREIGRLEGRLSQPAPKRVSSAPKPVGAVATGSGSQAEFDPQSASFDDVAQRLRAKGVIV